MCVSRWISPPVIRAEHGADAVQFLFSANPGQPMAPLTEVASGGEMSRFLLALKTTLADVDGSSTLLFDEIDAGVSGRVSGAMADLLQTLARQRQVFCVTHQPLVAAVADHHFRVSKHAVRRHHPFARCPDCGTLRNVSRSWQTSLVAIRPMPMQPACWTSEQLEGFGSS